MKRERMKWWKYFNLSLLVFSFFVVESLLKLPISKVRLKPN